MYTGSGHVFGLTGKEVPKGEWKMVELPDKNVKVEHCSCDNTGTFSLVVTDKGVVYFGGLNKKGEAAEPGVCAYVCMYVCTILLYIIVLYSQKFSPISPLALFFCEFFVMYQGSAQNDLSGG